MSRRPEQSDRFVRRVTLRKLSHPSWRGLVIPATTTAPEASIGDKETFVWISVLASLAMGLRMGRKFRQGFL